jgi:hypothetical protein
MSRILETLVEGSDQTMTDPLDGYYLEWLYALVGRPAENVNHFDLLTMLYSSEFFMLVPNDDNRCGDGLELRREFMREDIPVKVSRAWLSLGCSVLEMMIGVARHLSFEMDGEVGEWFWHLSDNLGLTKYHDKRFDARRVSEIIERLIWRQYEYNGKGGLFPLKAPYQDQRRVEIWFQMESYMLELN